MISRFHESSAVSPANDIIWLTLALVTTIESIRGYSDGIQMPHNKNLAFSKSHCPKGNSSTLPDVAKSNSPSELAVAAFFNHWVPLSYIVNESILTIRCVILLSTLTKGTIQVFKCINNAN